MNLQSKGLLENSTTSTVSTSGESCVEKGINMSPNAPIKTHASSRYLRRSVDDILPEIGDCSTKGNLMMKPFQLTRCLSSSQVDGMNNIKVGVKHLTSTTKKLLIRQRKISETYKLHSIQIDFTENDLRNKSVILTEDFPENNTITTKENCRVRKMSGILPPIAAPILTETDERLISQKYCKRWRRRKQLNERTQTSSLDEEDVFLANDSSRPLSLELHVTSSPEFQQVFRDLSIGTIKR